MPREVWLRANRRALSLGLALPLLLAAAGLLAVMRAGHPAVAVAGWTLIALAAYLLAGAVHALRQPRLAYQDGRLLVYLDPRGPQRVPVELVECFFLGQGPSLLPPQRGDQQPGETATVVVRLAESAEQWKHVDVKPAWGHWCDGYITIRGTWCEPIHGELVQRLNERLVTAHRAVRRHEAP